MRIEGALMPSVLDGLRCAKALERIRAIIEYGPNAYDIRDIKAALAEALGPYAYRVRPPCP